MDDFQVSAVNAPSDHYVDIYDQGVKINDQPVPVVDGVWRFAHTYSGGRHVLTAKAANAASAEYVFDVRDEVHEDFSGVYRDVTFGQEYTVLEELKHFSLRNTVDERYFYVTVGSSATLGSGLQKFLLQSAEVKFNTGWKKVKMQFVLSANWGVGPANYGRVTFYDQARRVLATCQTRALVDLTPDTVEYTAPDGSFIGYAIFGCANSGNAIRVTDMRMSM